MRPARAVVVGALHGVIRAFRPAEPMREDAPIVRRSLVVDGRVVSYLTVERAGGELVLLIHGAGVSARTWVHQLRHLPPPLWPVAIDLPGRRDSEPLPDPTLERYADVAGRLLEMLGDGPALVAGHSLGGAVAQVLARRHPERVKGLVLISTCARVPAGAGTHHLLGLVPAPFRRVVFLSAVRRLLLAPSASGDAVGLTLDELGVCPTRTIQADTAIGRAMDLGEVARALRVPTLVLCGARDRLTGPDLSWQLGRLIPGARLRIVPAAGHMLPLEAPALVNAAIAELAATAGGASPAPRRRLVERLGTWRPWRAWRRLFRYSGRP